MLNRIKEYLAQHPNSGIFTAILFSITTMTSDESVALITAFGMVASGVSSAILQHSRWRQDKRQKAIDLEHLKDEKILAFKKMELEMKRYDLETNVLIRNFEMNQNISNDGNE